MSRFSIKNWILLYSEHKRKQIIKKYSEIGNSIDIGIRIRIDNIPSKDSKLLYIGDKCIIGADFVYESGKGRVCIGDHTFIGGSTIISHNFISIGNYVQIAWGTYLYDHNAHSVDLRQRRNDISDEYESISKGLSDTANKKWQFVRSRPIIIEDDVWIGMNCIILNGVTVGRGSVIGAGSVIRRSVPPFCIVTGNPAKVVRFIYNANEIEDVQKFFYKDSNIISKAEYQQLIEQYLDKEV